VNGIHEVRGSIPLGSTISLAGRRPVDFAFFDQILLQPCRAPAAPSALRRIGSAVPAGFTAMPHSARHPAVVLLLIWRHHR
jgi:hypothetical protein